MLVPCSAENLIRPMHRITGCAQRPDGAGPHITSPYKTETSELKRLNDFVKVTQQVTAEGRFELRSVTKESMPLVPHHDAFHVCLDVYGEPFENLNGEPDWIWYGKVIFRATKLGCAVCIFHKSPSGRVSRGQKSWAFSTDRGPLAVGVFCPHLLL